MENYTIIIPNKVLSHKKLSLGAKMLYGEIATWCKRDGYCEQSNQYFGKLYQTHEMTISKWIKNLKKAHLIKCKIIRKKHVRLIFFQDTDKKYIEAVCEKYSYKNHIVDISKDIYSSLETTTKEKLNDDFIAETREWTDENGQRCGEDIIDES